MNFENLRKSSFFKFGKLRFDASSLTIIEKDVANYDTLCFTTVNEDIWNNIDTPSSFAGKGGTYPLPHLRRILTSGLIETDVKYALCSQWIEVNKVLEKMQGTGVIHSLLLIQPPGTIVPRHAHACKQTITFCYKFDDEKLENGDKSHFVVGSSDTRIDMIQDDKFCFMFRDSKPHSTYTNEWRFWWFFDYDRYLEFPKDNPFTYMQL